MTRKQWAMLTLSLIVFSIASIVALVALIDPFQVYHQAFAFIPPIENTTQNYSNAGIAKSYDYDSVIIGSSMTENFTPSQLDALLGGSFIKLPINAGTPFNNKQMMDMAFGTHTIQHVFYGVDIESFTWFYKTPKCEMPDYLYDDNLFNDTAYWFNKNILMTYIPKCLKTLGQSDPDQRDTMYNWGDMYEYGKDRALRDVTITGDAVPQQTGAAVLSQQSKLNVEHNILPYIENHPDTQFTFFFPPYSLVNWYSFYRTGSFEYHLLQKEALVDILLSYDNVSVYDFQAETDWILNLNNYIDASHYGPWINDAMVEAVSRGEYRVTDTRQVRQSAAVLRDLVDQVVKAGTWPDAFALPESPAQ